MNIPTVIWKSATRRKARCVFTLLGVTIGIASLVALLSLGGSLQNEVRKQASDLGANLLLTPKGWCAYEQISVLTGEQLPEAIPFGEVIKVSAIPGLRLAPYLTEKTSIQNSPVPVVGVLPAEMKAFRGWEIEKGRYFSSGAEKVAIIGAGIARQFNLSPGDDLRVRGERVPVLGILKDTGSKDDTAIFLPLAEAQRLYGVQDNVSFIAVKVDNVAKMDYYIATIQEKTNLAVSSDKQLLSAVLSLIGTVNLTLQLIAAVALVTAAFGIVNTMMTAINERRREIGILQAIGSTRRSIFSMFLLESGLYGLLGGIGGLAVGLAFSSIALPRLAQNEFTALFRGSSVCITLNLRLVLGSLLFSIVLSSLAGLYPSWQASRMTPVEAIRHG